METKTIRVQDHIYEAKVETGEIRFEFADDELKVSPKSEKDRGALYFYCSGGATLEGVYRRDWSVAENRN